VSQYVRAGQGLHQSKYIAVLQQNLANTTIWARQLRCKIVKKESLVSLIFAALGATFGFCVRGENKS